MGRAQTPSKLAAALPALRTPLSDKEKRDVFAYVKKLIAWQSELRDWPGTLATRDAIAFVTLYRDGKLVGCQGHHAGPNEQRLGRAFLAAASDTRFATTARTGDGKLAATISFPIAFTPILGADFTATFELGKHGLLLERDGRSLSVLLPHVASDNQFDAQKMLEALLRKANLTSLAESDVISLFETSDVYVHAQELRKRPHEPVESALDWLADRVDENGAIEFGVDPMTSEVRKFGPFNLGRAAIALQALQHHPRAKKKVKLAERWLHGEMLRGLCGERIDDWPHDLSQIAGTLALGILAGLPLKTELLRFLEAHKKNEWVAWHAAQAVYALNKEAPEFLWAACEKDLEKNPWAPWTLMAASTRKNTKLATKIADTLAMSIRYKAPYLGGGMTTPTPELALTALVVEALATLPKKEKRHVDAISRARDFLLSHQFYGTKHIPARFDLRAANGAFPIAPNIHWLRTDITAHAALAILATR